MKDKHGKDIAVGSLVKVGGKTLHVVGLLSASLNIALDRESELVPHGTRAGSDGDTIVWGG